MRRAKPLGEVLVDQRYITAEQLQEALLMQRSSRTERRLGQVLLDLKYMTLDDIIEALTVQKHGTR